MAYAFLFAGIGEYVSVCAGTSAYGLKINIYVVILFNFLRQCVGVVSLCEGFMAYAFLFSGKTFCGFPWVETSTAGRVYDLCVYCVTGAPEGSPKVVLCGFMVLWRSRESNLRPLVYKA